MMIGEISLSRTSNTNQFHGRIFFNGKFIQIFPKAFADNLSLRNTFLLGKDFQHVILLRLNINLNRFLL